MRITRLSLAVCLSTVITLPARAQDPAAAPAAETAQPAAAPEAAPATPPAPTPPAEPNKPKSAGPSLGLSPQAPQVGGLVTSPAAPPVVVEEGAASDEWKFEFKGYFRAPLRLSWGSPDSSPPGGATAADVSGTQIRTPPLVPDANYIEWRYTNSMVGPWTELNFLYGNSRARMMVQVASYNITDSSYRRLEAQLGINQAFLTLNFPEFISENGKLTLIAGAFTNRYGAAGRYDGGRYETYIMGRTHVAGATAQYQHDLGLLAINAEGGFGAKLWPSPWVGSVGGFEWMPYGGPTPQVSTLVQHLHLGLDIKRTWLVGLHYIETYGRDFERVHRLYNSPQANPTPAYPANANPNTGPNPSIRIIGGDVKQLSGILGDGYLGVSYLKATNYLPLADAIEVLHSFGGWQLDQNYFRPSTGATPGDVVNGNILTVSAQYVFSFGALMRYPAAFWGDGPDLIASVFGMWNRIDGTADGGVNGTQKLKAGTDLTYTPLPWLGVGYRFDWVSPYFKQPTGDLGRQEDFSVFSPRVILKTAFVTHEQILIQYSRYFNGDLVTGSWPYGNNPYAPGGLFRADKNAFQIAAIIWW